MIGMNVEKYFKHTERKASGINPFLRTVRMYTQHIQSSPPLLHLKGLREYVSGLLVGGYVLKCDLII